MEQNKIRTYLMYALGEIALVMIGILLALQVNNWNEERRETERMKGYYREVYEELQDNIAMTKDFIAGDSLVVELITESLRILDEANPDSLYKLRSTLGAVGTNYNRKYSFPVAEDLIANGYINNIQDDSLKIAFRYLKLFLERNEHINGYINDQYQLKIEPFFNSNINYSHVVLDYNKQDVYIGGPDTDYSQLVDNMEAWNIMNFKLEVSNAALGIRRQSLYLMKFLDKKIKEALDD